MKDRSLQRWGEPFWAGGEVGRSSATLLGGSRVTFTAELVHEGPQRPAQPPDEDFPRAAWPGGDLCDQGADGAELLPPPLWLSEHRLLVGEGQGHIWDTSASTIIKMCPLLISSGFFFFY